VLARPAGRTHNSPMIRSLWQLFMDSFRQLGRMIPIAISDYLRFGLLVTLRLF
jgi:hypothetical protein